MPVAANDRQRSKQAKVFETTNGSAYSLVADVKKVAYLGHGVSGRPICGRHRLVTIGKFRRILLEAKSS